ncbi:hypothetical protein ACKI16_47005, partial [Streptomyces scabiei]|uniref:hypothetical protein n=1 Tax=Streptomyces scabiei TaxID=1930 RepID=UPI0038F76A1F
MDVVFTEKERELFSKIGKVADELEIPCYLIGGYVRDKILNRTVKDVDIVCGGDGIALARTFANTLRPSPSVAFFKNFGTAQIKWEDVD